MYLTRSSWNQTWLSNFTQDNLDLQFDIQKAAIHLAAFLFVSRAIFSLKKQKALRQAALSAGRLWRHVRALEKSTPFFVKIASYEIYCI